MLPVAGLRTTNGSPAPYRAAARSVPLDPEARLAAEAQREHDVILAMIAEQRKRDDEILRRFIELI